MPRSSYDPLMVDEGAVDSLLDEFRLKVEPLGVTVSRVGGAANAIAMLAEWLAAMGATAVIVSDELAARAPTLVNELESAGVGVRAAGTPQETRDAPAGMSLAHLAIAETGSMLLAEPSLEDRSVGMLTLAQAIVCPTAALVPTLDEAVPLLREIALRPGGSFTTLVTGPSRTADIERVLTVGVQGPGVVMTLFVDEL
jgi:L-lactate dehydrogenase complex protein LldG